jgi:hypothetical protein
MIRPTKKLAKMDTAIGIRCVKGEMAEMIQKVKTAVKKLGSPYGDYGRGRIKR